MINVLIADDDALVRAGLSAILSSDSGIAVVGEAASGEAAVAEMRSKQVDVALLDVRMPGLGGIGAAEVLRRDIPECAIIFITTLDSDCDVRYAIDNNGSFLLKASSPSELQHCIHVAANGGVYITPRITARLLDQQPAYPRLPPALATLTAREEEVLRLLAQGESNAGIGRRLHVSEATVKVHIKAIMRKLDVDNRVKAAVIAVQAGLHTEPRDEEGESQ